MFLKNELENFIQNRPNSRRDWEKAKKVLPGGISHNIRTFGLHSIGAFPPIIKSAKGAYLTDVDNIRYVDCWMGHFAMILGHDSHEVQKAVKEQLDHGWHLGTITEFQIKLAEMIINDNPGVEMVRFCSSGTEATMYATRLARAYTKKRFILKALLGWHGANDTLYYGVGSLNRENYSPGLCSSEEAGILTYELNTEEVFDLIKKHSKDIAAVILEPMLGGGGGFRADLEYLKRLREETEKNDILLIFDEVITGYRFLYSLFQNELKVLPDLTTMGKIIGGGLPIGAIGGRRDIIERSSPLSENQVLIGGGTFSGYPISMIAGIKTLEILKRSEGEYERIDKLGTNLKNSLNKFFQESKSSIVATGYKSIVMLHTLSRFIENPNMREMIENGDKLREALLHLCLFNRKVLGLHGLGSLSMAHTPTDVKKIQDAIEDIANPITNYNFNS
jgi:glutamate-1-semialdehyde 2,1-aminomutase